MAFTVSTYSTPMRDFKDFLTIWIKYRKSVNEPEFALKLLLKFYVTIS